MMLVLPDDMIGRPVGFTCSTFDLLHAGHILMLAECKSVCDYLIVGLQSDPTIDRPDVKNKPVQSVVLSAHTRNPLDGFGPTNSIVRLVF